jgi:hypothetical protein
MKRHAAWLGFGRRRENLAGAAPDSGVAGPKAWLLSAAIVASTAALLGTSQGPYPDLEGESPFQTTYKFERLAIDGGFVELTADQPSASVFVTLRANDLGPDGVMSTEGANMLVQGDVTVSGIEDATLPPTLTITLSNPDNAHQTTRTTDAHFERPQDVVFTGDCQNPKASGGCMGRFRIDIARDDAGANGGTVRFDWSFDATGRGTLPHETENTELGPFDPPWTVELSQQ